MDWVSCEILRKFYRISGFGLVDFLRVLTICWFGL
jgi:hypothetical protein